MFSAIKQKLELFLLSRILRKHVCMNDVVFVAPRNFNDAEISDLVNNVLSHYDNATLVRMFSIFVKKMYSNYLPDFNNELLTRWLYVVACGRLLCPEYRFKWPQMEWWNDSRFTAYLERFDELQGFNTDRRWMLKQLLRLTLNVSGDMAECGCFKGASAWLMLVACKAQNKHLHLFDSFEGISEPDTKLDDSEYWTKGNLAASEDELKTNLYKLSADSHFTTYKGWIPERFSEVHGHTFSFVHIDVDLYQPTRSSMEFFYPRMQHGGIIVCDDYGFSTCPGATKAVNDFLEDKEEKMIELPSGGGFIVRGTSTATL